MTRYYHNENPQVQLWMEQARRNQELALSYKQSRDYHKDMTNHLLKELMKLEAEEEKFNKLPWYKKLFYKFDIYGRISKERHQGR